MWGSTVRVAVFFSLWNCEESKMGATEVERDALLSGCSTSTVFYDGDGTAGKPNHWVNVCEVEAEDSGSGTKFRFTAELAGAMSRWDVAQPCYGQVVCVVAGVERERWAEISLGDMEWCDLLLGARTGLDADYLRLRSGTGGASSGVRVATGCRLGLDGSAGLQGARSESTEVELGVLFPESDPEDVRWLCCVVYYMRGVEAADMFGWARVVRVADGE
jgi:hypothetical protein